MQAVGLIGLGNMGQPIAERVARFGPKTVVHDIREESLAPLRELGAEVAESPAALAARCDLVCLIVNTAAQLEDVMFGDNGLAAGARKGMTVAIHSTVVPKVCEDLAVECAGKGLVVIDAPVSGSEIAARDGTLTLMVGGDAAVLEACRPVFETYSSNIFHMGAVGTGQVAKLANNLMHIVNIHAVQEALKLAVSAGIAQDRMIEVAKTGSGDSWALRKFEYLVEMAELRYPGGTEALQNTVAKDLTSAIALAVEYGLSLPAATTTLENHNRLYTRVS